MALRETEAFWKPLGFHRVMEGNPIAAHDSPLFQVPTEVLDEIVGYLGENSADLASLALVNSDCRQLARSCQFRKITLEWTPRAKAILDVLLAEAQLRQQNQLGLSLGSCIRHIVTGTGKYWETIHALRPRKPGFSVDDSDEEAMDNDESKLDQWRSECDVVDQEVEDFLNMAHSAMSSLPHLYTLELNETVHLDQSFINWLLSFKTVRHLRKATFQMIGEIPSTHGLEWPLETLEMDLRWNSEYAYLGKRENLDASECCQNLLRPCAPTLRSLKLSFRQMVRAVNGKPLSFDLKFPQLRHLSLEWVNYESYEKSTLQSLILTSHWLSSLFIDFGNPHILQILQNAGQIPTLKTLVLNNSLLYENDAKYQEDQCASLSFLEENPQLTSFAIKHATKPHILDFALSKLHRTQLTKLSMSWQGKEDIQLGEHRMAEPSTSEIPETSLCALANMASLVDLHLDCISTSNMNVHQRDWFVDHDVIRNHLSPSLRKLTRLAFTRDIYEYFVNLFDMEFVRKFHNYTSLRGRDDWWEMHTDHMREQAVQYATAFPLLEFLHIGEISFGISRDKDLQIVLDVNDAENQKLSWIVGGHSGC